MKLSLKILVEGAICTAMSVALSFVKLFSMPQGGSISLALLPLVVFALKRGAAPGVTAGFATGVLRLFLGAYMVHPVQALLDYPLAYAAAGLAGFFPHRKYLGVLLGLFANMLCAVLSGVVFFGSYAPQGVNVWVYSIVYNGTTAVPEAVICCALVYFLWPRLEKI